MNDSFVDNDCLIDYTPNVLVKLAPTPATEPEPKPL
jgi:hypothetical protein